MQLTWLKDRRRFVGTQGEAKTLKVPFDVVEVPTSKPELMAYLNAIEERHEAATAALTTPFVRSEPETPAAEAPAAGIEQPEAPAPVMRDAQMAKFEALATKLGWSPPGHTVAAPKRALTEEILELESDKLIPVLSASIDRMSEIAGTNGWAAFTKNVYAWTPSARNVEQGLGMLMLAAMRQMFAKDVPSDESTD